MNAAGDTSRGGWDDQTSQVFDHQYDCSGGWWFVVVEMSPAKDRLLTEFATASPLVFSGTR